MRDALVFTLLAVLLTVTAIFANAIRRHRIQRNAFLNVNIEGVKYWAECLCESRNRDAYIIFTDMDNRSRFVQFRREVGAGGVSLRFKFPIAPWSFEYVTPLQEMLASKSIPYSESPIRDNEAGPVTGFITVANLDVSEAVNLVSAVFLNVFHCSSINVKVNGFGVQGKEGSEHWLAVSSRYK